MVPGSDEGKHSGWGLDLGVGIALGGLVGSIVTDVVANVLWPFKSPAHVFGSALAGWDWILIGSILGMVSGTILMRIVRAIRRRNHPSQANAAQKPDVIAGQSRESAASPQPEGPTRRGVRMPTFLLTSLVLVVAASTTTWAITASIHRTATRELEIEIVLLRARISDQTVRLSETEQALDEARARGNSLSAENFRLTLAAQIRRECLNPFESEGVALDDVDWFSLLVFLLQSSDSAGVRTLSLDTEDAGGLCTYWIPRSLVRD